MYDVFIIHADEDKDSIARPMAQALKQEGFKVWKISLNLNDSLLGKINQGLTESKFGIIILSPAFLSKSWTQYELDGLHTGEMESGKTLLSVWHLVSKSDIAQYSPALAGRAAVSTADGFKAVMREIVKVIHSFLTPPEFTQARGGGPRTINSGSENVDQVRLRQLLVRHFDLSELRTLSFDLRVNYDELAGQTASEFSMALITYLDRRGRLDELVRLARRLRPNAQWQ